MTLLNRESILSATDLTIEKVDLPEWGGHVFVKSMTGAERDRWEIQTVASGKNKAPENIRAQLAAMTVCDEAGALLFSVDDVIALSSKSAKALDRIMETALQVNGLSQKHVEELEKN
jgi:hypothetical protein